MNTSLIFDSNDPYKSIVNFTDNGAFLLRKQKEEFFSSLERFFSEHAYRGTSISIPAPTDFVKYDVPSLIALAKELELENRKIRINQLLANVSKVSGIAFTKYDENFPVYEFIHNSSWGWIKAKYVKGSEKLLSNVQGGKLVLHSLKFQPSTMLALQRFQEFTSKKTERQIVVDLSFEMLLDLVVFAVEWEVTPLQEELKKFYQVMKLPTRTPAEQEEYSKAKTGHPKRFQKMFEILENEAQKTPATSQRLIFPRYEDGASGSPCFDEENPYDSILRFTWGNCTLAKDAQLKFFSSVRLFFTQAYNGLSSKIPETLEDKFTYVALPFLMKTMQHNERERKRFLASIEIVTNRIFPKLSPQDQIEVVELPYPESTIPGRARKGWAQNDNNESSSSTPFLKVTKLEKSHLDISALEKATSEEVVSAYVARLRHNFCDEREKVEKILEDRIKKTPQDREEISTQLTKYLDCEAVKAFFLRVGMGHLKPRISDLDKFELTKLFTFLARQPVTDNNYYLMISIFIIKYLEPTPHLLFVLEEFEKGCLPDQKRALMDYCFNKVLGSIIHPRQKQFVEEALLKFKDDHSFFEDRNSRIELVALTKKFSLEENDIEDLFHFLQKAEIVEMLKRAGFAEERKWVFDGIIAMHPSLYATTIVNHLISDFFSNHKEDEDTGFRRNLTSYFENFIRGNWHSEAPYLAKAHPFPQEEIAEIYAVLSRKSFIPWLEENYQISLAYAIPYAFIEAYNAETVFLQVCLEREFAKAESENPPSSNAKSFILGLASTTEGPGEEVVERLLSRHQLLSEERVGILKLLQQENFKEILEENHKNTHKAATNSLERFDSSISFAEEFFMNFKFPSNEALSSKRNSVFEKIFKRTLEMTYRHQKEASYGMMNVRIGKNDFWGQFRAQAHQLLNQEEVKKWVEEKAGEFMFQALVKSIENTKSD